MKWGLSASPLVSGNTVLTAASRKWVTPCRTHHSPTEAQEETAFRPPTKGRPAEASQLRGRGVSDRWGENLRTAPVEGRKGDTRETEWSLLNSLWCSRSRNKVVTEVWTSCDKVRGPVSAATPHSQAPHRCPPEEMALCVSQLRTSRSPWGSPGSEPPAARSRKRNHCPSLTSFPFPLPN